MLNLDTLHTARLIQERSYPERLERTRIIRQAMEGAPKRRPIVVVAFGRLLARVGQWIEGFPEPTVAESICAACDATIPRPMAAGPPAT